MNALQLPSLAQLFLSALGIGTVLMLHILIVYHVGSPQTRRRIDTAMNTGRQINNSAVILAGITLGAAPLTLQLLQMLDGLSAKDRTLSIEVAVQSFGFFSIVAALLPLILSNERKYANSLTLATVGVLALGNFCGNIFKTLVSNNDLRPTWLGLTAVGFVTCSLVIFVALVFSIGRRYWPAMSQWWSSLRNGASQT